MKIKDYFDVLSSGELLNLFVGTGVNMSTKEIPEESYKQILVLTNLGLTDLHRRFNLRVNDVTIQEVNGLGNYKLLDRHAYTNNEDCVKYIVDSVYQPFSEDNYMSVIDIYTETGEQLSINNLADHRSAFLPTYNSINLPFDLDTHAAFVIYKECCDKVDVNNIDLEFNIDIPDFLIPALCAYVSSKKFKGVSADNQAGNMYTQQYEFLCREVSASDLIRGTEEVSYKFYRKGWK